ncbi:serine/arginine repetitive matrix protein 1-like isoform X1 [Pieris napi]|uniref:serine/arginine repetitive matrix protein 1-like isoform X1 n=2 Tax=Pieris napi TaxID=78633 RepID=UPI001FB86663|nr:serine/arginine repetitive matrix protein 1-like isoform X1 [Pieris napi]
MMVETILESSQDFGMSNGPLPQWKRELLQRRAARSRPPAPPATPPPQPPPPPPPPEEDEELSYGPGIVKRLKSRYLSLALREAPRRRPSVLRRAASLEHLLDERPPPAPRPSARPARPVSLAAPPPTAVPLRRDSVKRARSVDALSRLDEPPPQAPPSPLPRAPRPPRRPAPLLRDTERPPPDVVRSTLRKFETTPPRRSAPAARVSAVVRGLEAPRTSTPEPRARSPSPAAADLSAIDEPESTALSIETKQVSQAALDGIARAGSTVRYSFQSPKLGSHLPPLATTNPVLLNRVRLSASPRRVGVIKPMPAPCADVASPPPERTADVIDELPRLETPPPDAPESPVTARTERKDPPPSAVVEPIPRPPPEKTEMERDQSASREPSPEVDLKLEPIVKLESPKMSEKPLMNGHATPERSLKTAGVERAWTGAGPEGGAGPRRLRSAVPASTSVVFNFSHRKEVPDYIENDGIVLRAAKRNRFKAGESGVVLLKGAEVPAESDSDGEAEVDGARSPSPCSVRFVNDNVLINGRSSMLARTPLHRERAAKLKLQFDDSLTRTFEYPSEISLCEDEPSPAAPPAPPAATSALATNTTIGGGSGGLSRYTPSKTVADTFQLGLSRTHQAPEASDCKVTSNGAEAEAEADAESGDARPCAADSARSWSESRTHTTDLLF